MKRFTRFLGIAILAVAAVALCGQRADAGRIGGPASDIAIVPAYQSVYFDVPLHAGTAIVAIVGNGSTNLALYLYDGDGNVAQGGRRGDRQMAIMNVYRPGFFRIEVRNFGPVANILSSVRTRAWRER